MKKVLSSAILAFLCIPTLALAACTENGATVIYVNGVFNTKQEAQQDLENLGDLYLNRTRDSSVHFYNGYNPTHLAGLGDLVESVSQMLDRPVSSFDLDTMLMQIHPQVTTRRLLLVGHSQGALYTNEMYKYLLAHGEPREAVGIYAVATPASTVAGGGKYFNSTNDMLLNTVDAIAGKSSLPRNITLPIADADLGSDWPGHSLSKAYLAQGADRVVGDIKGELDALKPTWASNNGECFSAPDAGLGYEAAKAGFVVADASANGAVIGLKIAQAVGTKVGDGFIAAAAGAWDLGKKVIADTGVTVGGVSGLSQAATDEKQPTNFNILSKLYGSSLSPEDIKDLLGQQAPAVATADIFNPQAPQDTQAPVTIYLTGSRDSATTTDVSETVNPSDATTTEPAATSTGSVATTTDPVATSTATSTVPTPSELAGDIVINEVAWSGTGVSANDQWIELFNTTGDDIDLATTSLAVGTSDPMPLSGTLSSHGYVILERDGALIGGTPPEPVVVNFGPLSSDAEQISLLDSAGKIIDQTPNEDACGGDWCAGSTATQHYADYANPKPLSMERVDAHEDGTDPDNWASNDGYKRAGGDRNNQEIIGTPRVANSKHWPPAGFFCGSEDDMLEPGASGAYSPAGTHCTALWGDVEGRLTVAGGVFKGTVGSSTQVQPVIFSGRQSGSSKVSNTFSLPAEPGDYFVAMWQYDNNVGGGFGAAQVAPTISNLTTGTPTEAPLGFITILFTLEE
jgi:hypothetical protein